MASFCNQVRDSCHGCSKAQACLKKILHTISSIPPCEIPNSVKRGVDVDLNLRLGSSLLEFDEKSESLAENSTEVDSINLEVDVDRAEEERKADVIVEKTTPEESSVITDLPKVEMRDAKSGECDCDIPAPTTPTAPFRNKRQRDSDSFALLIEAAEMISEMERTEAVEIESKKKTWIEECEDITEPPVVRSRRGRSSVLPYRYRDTVLEAWRRPQRSAAVSKEKRRPR